MPQSIADAIVPRKTLSTPGRNDRHDYRRACRLKGGQLVPGPHRVWSTLARCTLDPGRSALTNHTAQPQPEGQVSRELSAVRAFGPAHRQSKHQLALHGRLAAAFARASSRSRLIGGCRQRVYEKRRYSGVMAMLVQDLATAKVLRCDPRRGAVAALSVGARHTGAGPAARSAAICTSSTTRAVILDPSFEAAHR
jgi:hypothetical protein